MALELHVAGPGLDVVRRLEAGQPELVLGRDADCDVCLPDPQRNVSRRHLSLWVEEGELHFRVLSVVNGVEMPFGEAPPGARGVLANGQALKLAEYTVSAEAVPEAQSDPWAVLDREGAGGTPVPRVVHDSPAPGQAGGFTASTAAEEDPFGDWGFETTFAPGGVGGEPADAGTPVPGDLGAFFRGLGIDPAAVGALGDEEVEAMGHLVRVLVVGVLELHASASGVKQDLRAEDRTMMATRDDNPLKTGWPHDTKLRYLFGGRKGGVGFMGAERAARELLVELIAHNTASGAATRAALESTLKEFAPGSIKARLLGDGPKLFEGTRAWYAYVKYYRDQGGDMGRWAQRLLDKYFTEAYLRESLRIRRETPPRKR